jgi:hypothetical protein
MLVQVTCPCCGLRLCADIEADGALDRCNCGQEIRTKLRTDLPPLFVPRSVLLS